MNTFDKEFVSSFDEEFTGRVSSDWAWELGNWALDYIISVATKVEGNRIRTDYHRKTKNRNRRRK